MPNATPLLIAIVSCSAAAVLIMGWVLVRTQEALHTAKCDLDYANDSLDHLWRKALDDDDCIAILQSSLDASYEENWELRQHLTAIRGALASMIDAEDISDDIVDDDYIFPATEVPF